jgi:hypothetical protein
VAGESRTLRAENTLVDQEKVKRMDLHMVRRKFSPISTIGEWYINQKSFCWTLEDMDRQIQKDGSILPWDKRLKLYGLTAIPYGTYEVITNYSVRFKRVMPLILDVPDFKGIRIHVLNWAEETEGCIGLGKEYGEDCIKRSLEAFNEFMPILTGALDRNERVFLTISKEA